MAGVIFIVNVPKKVQEEELNKKEKTVKIIIHNDRYEKQSKVIDELRENKKFDSLRSTIESYVQDDNNMVISKCKSTDCLHKNDKENGLCKSQSENSVTVNKLSLGSDSKGYLKTSWQEVKQVMKPRRNKLTITRPGRGVDILGAFRRDTPLETILSEVIARLGIKNAAWNSTRDEKFWQVTFSLESGNLCEELLQVLRAFGIGSRHHSSVSVIPCALYYKCSHNNNEETAEKDSTEIQSASDSAWSRFSSSVRARNNLAQVLQEVRADATLTFDWLFLLIVAAFVAAIGLVENSTVILVASMLISPLMGPITAGTLGTAVRDRSLQHMGVLHELLGLFLSLVIGFIFGLAICAMDERYGVGDWPTYEMMSRCEIRSLWVGVLVAIPSGAGVALAVLGEYTASLVGVAISASLLPPAVNAGLLWAMALIHLIFMDDNTRWTGVVKTSLYSTNHASELAVLGTVSLCLTLVNIICIFLAGVTVYKIKAVCPLERRNITWWRANKSSLHTSKPKDPSVAWEIYSKWCNESQESEEEFNKDPAVGLVQSDTVTYRRQQPLTQRLKAQNIEAYCHRKTQLNEHYMQLDLETETDNNDKNNVADNPNKSEDFKSDTIGNTECNTESTRSLDNDNNYSFYNLGFNIDEVAKNLECNSDGCPTIEPSLNFTVDTKKYDIVLGSKSFNV